MPFGQNAFNTVGSGQLGRPVSTIASGRPRYKTGGITICYPVITALGADTTVQAEGRTYKAGDKLVRFGTIMCKITSVVGSSVVGQYGPYASGATDGRQTLTRGECFILDHSISQLADLASDITGAVYDSVPDGQVYMDRIASDGTNGVSTNPAKAAILTAFPGISPFED